MSLQRFLEKAVSEWMSGEGPDSDIVISSRVRLARNLRLHPFPMLATESQAKEIIGQVSQVMNTEEFQNLDQFETLYLNDISGLEKRVLVEKHLISPHLANESRHGAVILSENEAVSIMVNEEDHLRIQCLFPGFQLKEAWNISNQIDDVFESYLDFAFDERRGYLTSCPTNVGTGIRASVMMHLPALVLTQQINRILAAIGQIGLVVRGIYGEGSEAAGNLFQISNQITLGHSEEEIIDNLYNVANQIIDHERAARKTLLEHNKIEVEDKLCRSYGILSNARVIESKEAATRLSDLRLAIDTGLIQGISPKVINELMVLIQPGFLQLYSGKDLTPEQRDVRRAKLIRERLLSVVDQ
ncbi:protein arginine kinase [Ammoniphilus sp. CFH 90114]|uniref:protein arginine kinase n=1 Tax=Ammoniphilus sp. CFH 90114 TaxID=2493665 RepID=UPI00100E87B9|nr:protein arginine kinase [Ammoniphilus sp. CFH 90114]RXT09045.1 protein arginine kinase [Ammoniphilus sp. CFH 90114]